MKLNRFLAGAGLFTMLTAGSFAHDEKNYIENFLIRLEKQQEQKLEIKHFGLPKLDFGEKKSGVYAEYYPDSDQIYVYDDEKSCMNSIIFADTNLLETITYKKLKNRMDHELGHYYADKLSESIGNGNWPQDDSTLDKMEAKCIKIISEGIAEYFRREMNNMPDTFNDYQYPRDPTDFLNEKMGADYYLYYSGGYHLVKPVIEEFGKVGIEYMIKNPPTLEDMKNLPLYRNRAMEYLRTTRI